MKTQLLNLAIRRISTALPLAVSAVLLSAAPAAFADESTITVPTEQGENCLYARQIKDMEVLDEQHILVRGSGQRFWLSALRTSCDGLDERKLLSVHRYGSKLCANDRFDVQDRGGFTVRTACRFGEFQPVASEQVPGLRQQTKES